MHFSADMGMACMGTGMGAPGHETWGQGDVWLVHVCGLNVFSFPLLSSPLGVRSASGKVLTG